jgi:hypothetical protein
LTIFPVLAPLLDLLRVALGTATLRSFVTPIEFLKVIAGGSGSYVDIEFRFEKPSNAGACPEITFEAVCFCSVEQKLFEFGKFLVREFGMSAAAARFGVESFHSLLFDLRFQS